MLDVVQHGNGKLDLVHHGNGKCNARSCASTNNILNIRYVYVFQMTYACLRSALMLMHACARLFMYVCTSVHRMYTLVRRCEYIPTLRVSVRVCVCVGMCVRVGMCV